MTVSRERFITVDSAFDACQRIEDLVASRFGPMLTVTVGLQNADNPHSRAIYVEYPEIHTSLGETKALNESFSQVNRVLPATIDGVAGRDTTKEIVVKNIPVFLERTTERPEVYDYRYRPVPGGCRIQNRERANCTLGTPVWDRRLNRHTFITAGHCVNEYSERNAYQPRRNAFDSYIGVRKRNRTTPVPSFDAAVVDNSQRLKVAYRMAHPGGAYQYFIKGVRSKWFMHNALGYFVFKRGYSTGEKRGRVTRVGTYTVEATMASNNGDSGGPVFEKRRNNDGRVNIWLWSIHRGRITRNGVRYSKGTQMAEIEDRYDVRIPRPGP